MVEFPVLCEDCEKIINVVKKDEQTVCDRIEKLEERIKKIESRLKELDARTFDLITFA